MNLENVHPTNPHAAEVIIHDERSIGRGLAVYTVNGELLAKQAPPEKKESIGDEFKRHYDSSRMDKQPCAMCERPQEVSIVLHLVNAPDPLHAKHYFCSYYCLSVWTRGKLSERGTESVKVTLT